MENLYYIVIILLILFKVIFWTFFFYMRNKRLHEARQQRRIIIVDSGVRLPHNIRINTHDQASIVNNEVIPESNFLAAPPSYTDAVSDETSKPPSYEHVIAQSTPQPPFKQDSTTVNIS